MRQVLVLIIFSFLFFLSCADKQVELALKYAEMNMDELPECSLDSLKSIDKSQLISSRQKARFALLYSIALDKNYIDVQSDSIIAPALDYYKRHGSINEKFQCYYYAARMYENKSDHQNTLLYSAKAESLDTSKIDPYKLALLYAMKGTVYQQAWRITDAIDSYTLASRYSLKAEKYRHYVFYTLLLAESYRYGHNIGMSIQSVNNAYEYKSYFTESDFHLYHRLVLLNMKDSHVDVQECIRYAEEYIKNHPQEQLIYWDVIADIYLRAGFPEHAYDLLERYKNHQYFDIEYGYYGTLSKILEQIGDYKEALATHYRFAEMIKTRDVARHRSNIKLVEEQYRSRLIHTRQKHLILYFATIALIILCITIHLNVKWRNERRQNMQNLTDLKHEYDALTMLKERLESTNKYLRGQLSEHSSPDGELLKVLGHRMKSLSAFLQKPIPDSLYKVVPQIENLKKSKNYLVDNIGLLYAVTYPDFVSELRQHDLTSSEIGYCCLLLLGLNIPEAGEVIGRVSSIYNVNSAIRKKLGITGQNLDKWLINRFVELYPNHVR